MTKEEAIEQLTELKKMERYDIEVSHIRADEVLCKFLKAQGYAKIVKLFEKLLKWYA